MKYVSSLLLILQISCYLFSGTINGIIINKINGSPIAYANVIIEETSQGTFTDRDGLFSFVVTHCGHFTLRVYHLAYYTYETKFHINDQNDTVFKTIELTVQAINMDEIRVVAERDWLEINQRDVAISRISRTAEQLRSGIVVAEPDVFQSILSMPGVTSISDFSSGMYVRGGSIEQNQILWDGIEIFNPTHFGGFFSAFNIDSVDNAVLYKGGFPAKYGGRISSVLDVRNRDGSYDHHRGVARMSLISLSAAIDGPWAFGSENGTYAGSFRRSHLEIMNQIIDDLPDYYFYDGHIKLNWHLNQRNRLSTNAFISYDNLIFNNDLDLDLTMSSNWGNTAVSTQWKHIINTKYITNVTISNSQFRFNLDEDFGLNKYTNKIYDTTVSGMIYCIPNDNHLIEMGIQAKYNTFRFDHKNDINFYQEDMPHFHFNVLTTDFFIQNSWTINPQWTLKPGVRITNFSTLYRNLEQSPKADYWRTSPRIALRRKITRDSEIVFSYGRYYQFLNVITNDINSPYHIWIPIDGSLKPSFSDHYVLGYKHNLSEGLAFSLEFYHKNMGNIVEYNRETNLHFDQHTTTFDEVFRKGKGNVLGADFLLLTNKWGWEGFIGYSLCISRRKHDGMNINPITNKAEYYFPKHDRTHQFNTMQSLNMTEQWGWQFRNGDMIFGISYAYATGQPGRIPEKVYYGNDHLVILYSFSDRQRLPDYSRVDLSFKMRWHKTNYTIEPYFQIVNVFNSRNVFSRNYSIELDDNNQLNIIPRDINQFPLIPFVGVNVFW